MRAYACVYVTNTCLFIRLNRESATFDVYLTSSCFLTAKSTIQIFLLIFLELPITISKVAFLFNVNATCER
jgi:hypothetical protein